VGASDVPTSTIRDELAAFIARELGLSERAIPTSGDWSECGQTIGAFALRLGALSLDQIDAIVDLQYHQSQKFGEIAIQLGYLTRVQVDRLLQLQDMHRGLELGERLILSGDLDVARLCELLAAFHRER